MPPKKKAKTNTPKAKWEYQGDDGTFLEYDEEDCALIETAYASGAPSLVTTDLTFNKGFDSKYTFDFTAKTQHNGSSGKTRTIRRVAPAGAWEWIDDHGIFVQFYDEDTALIEKAYRATGLNKEFKTKDLSFNKGFDTAYVFVFKSEGPAEGEVHGTQTNQDSGNLRQVRRLASSPKAWETKGYGLLGAVASSPTTSPTSGVSGATFPEYWTPQKFEVDRVVISESSKEYKDVLAHFKKTISVAKVKILSITRLQNYALYKFYAMTRDHIASRNKGDAGELLLWHGARLRQNMEAIIQYGFDMRVANSGSVGLGIYFAVKAQYSNCGYVLQNPDKSKEMFLCRVVCGSHTQGVGGSRRPPPKDPKNPTGDLYDSVTNGKPPIMHVVFNNWQAYPEYVIHYMA